MDTNKKQTEKWYQKKIFLIPTILLVSLISLASSDSQNVTSRDNFSSETTETLSTVKGDIKQNSQENTNPDSLKISDPVEQEGLEVSEVTDSPAKEVLIKTPSSQEDYYTNVDGNEIHAPVSAPVRPAGASAKCRDGTYSFSAHRSGTCSHHGGVSVWY